MERDKIDIHERIFKFVVDVLKICERLPKTDVNKVITGQLLRAVTSVGANDQEIDGTTTIKDFINKYSIVRKEAKETRFWLRVALKMNPKYSYLINSKIKEGIEIVKIVSQIIFNSQKKIKK